MKIDWIHAPDWAEAVGVRLCKSGNYAYAFICPTGYNYKLELGKKAKCHPFNDGHAIGDFSIIEFRPKASAITWTGEGLPPVGKATCEYLGAHQYNLWTVVDIFAHRGEEVFVDFGDGWRVERNLKRFRPIRTPEQIAAEDREAKAKALFCAVNWDDGEAIWKRLPDERKNDYRKAIDEGWTMVPRA